MNVRRIVAVCLASAALSLAGAGVALADHEDDSEGYPSTQSPSQGQDAGQATFDNSSDSFQDAANGDDRPDGADGTDTEFGQPDPRFIEGPLGGLAENGPLE